MKTQDILDSENDYHIDCWNLSHCQQQSHSGLTSTRRILWCYHSNEISQTERFCSDIFFIGFYKENFEFFRFIFFTILLVHVHSRVKGWISFLSLLFFFLGPVLMDEFVEWYQLNHRFQSSSSWIYCFTKEIYSIEGM